MAITGYTKRKRLSSANTPLPVVTWLLPAWFHGYSFFGLFAAGFYRESAWMTGWAIVNLLAGFFIHLRLFSAIQKKQQQQPV